jgi:flagellar biosynthetic protein FlhB
MAEDAQNKKHSASVKRLEQLRREGQVLRSRDFTGGLVLILTVAFIMTFSSTFHDRLAGNFILAFNSIAELSRDSESFLHIIHYIVLKNFLILLPIMLVVFFAALFSPFIFGGWSFTLEILQFKIYRLNFFTNVINLFSFQKASSEFLKALMKLFVIFVTLFIFISMHKHDISNLSAMSHRAATAACFQLIKAYLICIAFALLAIIGCDLLYQWHTFSSKNKMTDQEMKDEGKESEGSPEMKQKMKSAQMALVRQRIKQSVPMATVIITNPSHYAIALRYTEGQDKAPVVLAKGKDMLAQQIKAIAAKCGIPMYEAPPLARALYHTTDINDSIDPQLYKAVAIVLFYVNQLRFYKQGLAQAPVMVPDLQVPPGFNFD